MNRYIAGQAVIATQTREKLQRGFERHLAGDGRTAAHLYAEVLTADPSNADAWHLSGLIAYQHHRLADAEQLIRRALDLRPATDEFQSNLAAVLLAAGRPAEAERLCREILQQNPEHHESLTHLGAALRNLERNHEAAEIFAAAAARLPGSAEALCNLGGVLVEIGRLEEALKALLNARSLNDRLPQIHLNLGAVQRQLQQSDAALESLRRAAELAPDLNEPRINRGNLLLELGRADEAMLEYEQVLASRPECVPALAGLGQCLQAMGQWNDAMEAFRLAAGQADRQSRSVAGHTATGHTATSADAVREISGTKRRLMSNLLYCATLAPDLSRHCVFSLHAAWGAALERATPEMRHEAGTDPERRLRIGYVSPDFRQHATMQFFLPFLRNHDHRRVEVFCYSENTRTDEVTQQVAAHADGWRQTSGLSDEQMENAIQRDQIDVLIDIAGHTAGNRLPVLARRPAPVQVSFLGYPGTTGLSRVDYLLTDAVRENSRSQCFFTEQLVGMPHGACCYEPGREASDVAECPAVRNGYITLGSTHRPEKLSPACLQVWARLLQEIPDSRLLIVRDVLGKSARVRTQLVGQLQHAGIDLSRVEVSGDVPRNHLEIYSRMDLLLDVFPWPGGTTNYEAMWMGVPVPTYRAPDQTGCLPWTQATASLLHHCGLPHLIAASAGDYVRIVSGLASSPQELSRLRVATRGQMRDSVCSGKRFAAELEAVYQSMWRRFCGQSLADSGLPLLSVTSGDAA